MKHYTPRKKKKTGIYGVDIWRPIRGSRFWRTKGVWVGLFGGENGKFGKRFDERQYLATRGLTTIRETIISCLHLSSMVNCRFLNRQQMFGHINFRLFVQIIFFQRRMSWSKWQHSPAPQMSLLVAMMIAAGRNSTKFDNDWAEDKSHSLAFV